MTLVKLPILPTLLKRWGMAANEGNTEQKHRITNINTAHIGSLYKQF